MNYDEMEQLWAAQPSAPGVTIDAARLVSKSKNTPFGGWTLKGGVAATIVGGRVVYTNPDVPRARALTPVSVA